MEYFMTLQTWLAFVLAAGIILVIPGPTILAVISHSLAHGRRAIVALVAGVVLGDFTAMTCSLAGLGVILAASAELFSALKLLGALYLVYLGIKLWHSDSRTAATASPVKKRSNKSLFTDLYVITALNPKSIAFFIAFLPQFVAPSERTLPQLLVLGGTFLLLAAVNAAFYAFFSGSLREKVQRSETRRLLNRIGGTVLISAGIVTAAVRRS
jgi:threonine/homoserine/homoserine lactone efflux protein